MPSGYTADVQHGISFNQYAWKCARAFGALAGLRDSPDDVAIPKVFEPEDYHLKELKSAEKHLLKLKKMRNATKIKMAKAYNDERQAYANTRIREINLILIRYKEMLAMARAWKPPSSEYTNYKQYMIDQLESSIKWDCDSSYYLEQLDKVISVKEWYDAEVDSALHDIEYHTKHYQEDIETAAQRTSWVQTLRDSIGEPTIVVKKK